MGKRNIFLTSNGLSNNMKNLFIKQVGKNADEIKVLFVPTAGIGNDGAREGAAVCFHELTQMRISNICVYHLDMVPSKNYQRTYSAYVQRPHMLTRLMTVDLQGTDQVKLADGWTVYINDEGAMLQC